ncbi:MAG: hypothetical protein JWO83_3738 [Caulobacteraceae bacterium]|nr:hypothetical protein [Caulobacteraceae bacterium]
MVAASAATIIVSQTLGFRPPLSSIERRVYS